MEMAARFADEDEIRRLEERGYQSMTSETGKVVVPSEGVRFAETIKLKLARFLWSKKIVVDGLEYAG